MTMEELVDAADGIVAELAPRQTRYKVTDRPDARTIRYYVTQGLLPKPLGYDGGRARYGGTHLLRLLFIKQLQADHHTLTRIGALLEGKTDEDVLARIVSGAAESLETVEPALHVSPSSGAPRLALAPGGWVEVPGGVLSDPKKRAQLAENLEALAAWLRQTGGES
jgi:DNA-binding transcriptional MerR regulator